MRILITMTPKKKKAKNTTSCIKQIVPGFKSTKNLPL
jgi:hypothetical protein